MRKGFSGVVTDANVDNEKQQQEGISNASSDQPSVSSSSEILLPAPILPYPDIVCYAKQTVVRLICDSIETTEINRDTKANKGITGHIFFYCTYLDMYKLRFLL